LKKRIVFGVLVFLVSGIASADSLEISLGSQTARFIYRAHFGNEQFAVNQFDLGLLYDNDDELIEHLGLHVTGPAGSESPGLDVGVGVRAYAMQANDADAAGVALGGFLDYSPPALDRVDLVLGGYYAPNIVSFMDADGLYEWYTHVGYKILPRASAFLGYRKFNASLGRGQDVKIDGNLHFGLAFAF